MRLTAADLACVRGGRQVFAGLNFALESGQGLLLTGPNGAGKTSLLRLIAGLLQPSGGTLRLDAGETEASLAEQAHYLGHLDPLKRSLTLTENLRFWADMLGSDGLSPGEALTRANLASIADLPAGFLSAGQRRRLSMARLLVAPRPVWLLDEPTASLDTASQQLFLALMRDHVAQGGLLIAATHTPWDMPNARQLRLGSG